MPRPRKCRRVACEPDVTYFKPAGVPLRQLSESEVSIDELEAIKLVDFGEMDQVSASKKMEISQPTLHRLLRSGRNKVAKALIRGQAIKILGGDYYIKK